MRFVLFFLFTQISFIQQFFFFGLSRATPVAYGGSPDWGQIGDVATCLHHSHSNAGSKPHLRPTPQLKATPDP